LELHSTRFKNSTLFRSGTILDKEHEATLNYNSLPGYFTLLHRQGHAGLVAQQYFGKGVLLLRNPMDVVFTYRNWLTNGIGYTCKYPSFTILKFLCV
jgi:hypothetical protein